MPVALPQLVVRSSFRCFTEYFPCSVDLLDLSSHLPQSSVLDRVPSPRQTTPRSSGLFSGRDGLDPQCNVVVR